MTDIRETAWDHVAGEKTASIFSSEKKWINLITRLHKDYPGEVEILYTNEDGSILAHIPTEWLKIKPKRKGNLSEEQIAASRKRLELARQKRWEDLREADAAVAERR